MNVGGPFGERPLPYCLASPSNEKPEAVQDRLRQIVAEVAWKKGDYLP